METTCFHIDSSDLWARRQQCRLETLTRFRGESFIQTRKEFETVPKTESQPTTFSKMILFALKEKKKSKDSTGLWMRRKEKRFQLLAGYRNLFELEQDCKEQKLKVVDPPVVRKKICFPLTDQRPAPHRHPTGVWELRKSSWSTKFAHVGHTNSVMVKPIAQNLGTQEQRKKTNDRSGKKNTQTGDLKRHPKFQNHQKCRETKGSCPRTYHQPRPQNSCCHCHSVLDNQKKANDSCQQRYRRGNFTNSSNPRCQVPSKFCINWDHQSSLVQATKRSRAKGQTNIQSRRSTPYDPQKNCKKQNRMEKTDRSPTRSDKKPIVKVDLRIKLNAERQKREKTSNKTKEEPKNLTDSLVQSLSQLLL